ncbi:hypothetical protein [Nocardia araoensis]|uniref:hypothetical protein n=1 Tax=Nocardia araoensis TaxID=228600 RepID=UPI0012F62254|nr:hypothetical protein [Nocardia araoensis]
MTAIAFGCVFTVAPACRRDSAAVHCVIDLLAIAGIVRSSAQAGPGPPLRTTTAAEDPTTRPCSVTLRC